MIRAFETVWWWFFTSRSFTNSLFVCSYAFIIKRKIENFFPLSISFCFFFSSSLSFILSIRSAVSLCLWLLLHAMSSFFLYHLKYLQLPSNTVKCHCILFICFWLLLSFMLRFIIFSERLRMAVAMWISPGEKNTTETTNTTNRHCLCMSLSPYGIM